MNNKFTSKANNVLIILGVIGLFMVGILGANVFLKLQSTGRDETSLKTKSSKLKNTKLNVVTTDDPSYGSINAKVHIVEFSDFQCPYCLQSYPIVKQILKEYGDKIYFVYRDFPLAIHPDAPKAAEAGECAQDQGAFWPMHNIIFDNQENITVPDLKKYAKQLRLNTVKFNQCLDSGQYKKEIAEDYKDGEAAGVRGTPTFFINDKMIFGSASLERMKAVIDMELIK